MDSAEDEPPAPLAEPDAPGWKLPLGLALVLAVGGTLALVGTFHVVPRLSWVREQTGHDWPVLQWSALGAAAAGAILTALAARRLPASLAVVAALFPWVTGTFVAGSWIDLAADIAAKASTLPEVDPTIGPVRPTELLVLGISEAVQVRAVGEALAVVPLWGIGIGLVVAALSGRRPLRGVGALAGLAAALPLGVYVRLALDPERAHPFEPAGMSATATGLAVVATLAALAVGSTKNPRRIALACAGTAATALATLASLLCVFNARLSEAYAALAHVPVDALRSDALFAALAEDLLPVDTLVRVGSSLGALPVVVLAVWASVRRRPSLVVLLGAGGLLVAAGLVVERDLALRDRIADRSARLETRRWPASFQPVTVHGMTGEATAIVVVDEESVTLPDGRAAPLEPGGEALRQLIAGLAPPVPDAYEPRIVGEEGRMERAEPMLSPRVGASVSLAVDGRVTSEHLSGLFRALADARVSHLLLVGMPPAPAEDVGPSSAATDLRRRLPELVVPSTAVAALTLDLVPGIEQDGPTETTPTAGLVGGGEIRLRRLGGGPEDRFPLDLSAPGPGELVGSARVDVYLRLLPHAGVQDLADSVVWLEQRGFRPRVLAGDLPPEPAPPSSAGDASAAAPAPDPLPPASSPARGRPSPASSRGVPRVKETVSVRGPLPREVVARIVRQHVGELRMCYQLVLQRRPKAAGTVVVFFVVEQSGQTAGAEPRQNTVGDEAAAACIVNAVRRWQFPHPKDAPAEVTLRAELNLG